MEDEEFVLTRTFMSRNELEEELIELLDRYTMEQAGEPVKRPLDLKELDELYHLLEVESGDDEWDILINEDYRFDYFMDDYNYLIRDIPEYVKVDREKTIDNLISARDDLTWLTYFGKSYIAYHE